MCGFYFLVDEILQIFFHVLQLLLEHIRQILFQFFDTVFHTLGHISAASRVVGLLLPPLLCCLLGKLFFLLQLPFSLQLRQLALALSLTVALLIFAFLLRGRGSRQRRSWCRWPLHTIDRYEGLDLEPRCTSTWVPFDSIDECLHHLCNFFCRDRVHDRHRFAFTKKLNCRYL